MTRRTLILSAATLPLLPGTLLPGPDWLATLAQRVQALGTQAPGTQALNVRAAAGAGLLQSYEVAGNGAFDRAHAKCAYVYDNAVAGMALLAGGHVQAARRLGDALLAAQARDRFWKDGRFRNAYASGPLAATGDYPLPGRWDAAEARWVEDRYQVSSATGVVAWAALFLVALHRAMTGASTDATGGATGGETRDATGGATAEATGGETRRGTHGAAGAATGADAYREAAERAGDWIERAVRVPSGYAGGFLGWEPSPAPLGWVSTEHNLDCAVLFAALGREAAAAHARDFVARMWQAGEGRFAAGLTPSGATNLFSAVDANIWPLLEPGAQPGWAAARAWVMARHGVPPVSPAGSPEGVDFNTDRDGIWLEGTAYVALAARLAGEPTLAARMMGTLRAQTGGTGLVYACSVPSLTTGLSTGLGEAADFVYYRRPHVGATGWAALAGLGANPFATL